jgi:hypothetical protein
VKIISSPGAVKAPCNPANKDIPEKSPSLPSCANCDPRFKAPVTKLFES